MVPGMSRSLLGALSVLGAAVLLAQLPFTHATAWHFFGLAADLLVGDGPTGDADGLRLYADHPELQFGPVVVLAALPLTLPGSDVGELAAMALASALAVVVVRLLYDAIGLLHPGAAAPRWWEAAVGGAVLVVTWGDVAVRTAHVDDAIALAATVAAVHALGCGRAGRATALLTLAAAAKPWAVVFVPLLWLFPGRSGWARPVVAAGAAVATWVPFVIAAPETLDAADFGITNDPTSVLRALGFDAATTPGWVRPVQLVGGLLAVGLVVLVGRWPGAILAGISWRLLFDPGAHRYYTVGFVIGALVLELTARPGKPPWFTVVGAVALELTAVPGGPVGPGQAVRLATIIGAFVAVARVNPEATPTVARR